MKRTFFNLLFLFTVLEARDVPWLTEESIVFLDQYLKEHKDAKILEFGCGASTIWFSKRTKNLTSVEHALDWHYNTAVKINQDPNCNPVNLIYRKTPYYSICESLEKGSFDLILVDGRNRKGCIANAIQLLKPGGVLMLDNSERTYYFKVFDLMKNWETVITHQKKPDSCGFWYKNWQTRWWIKPKKELVKQ